MNIMSTQRNYIPDDHQKAKRKLGTTAISEGFMETDHQQAKGMAGLEDKANQYQ